MARAGWLCTLSLFTLLGVAPLACDDPPGVVPPPRSSTSAGGGTTKDAGPSDAAGGQEPDAGSGGAKPEAPIYLAVRPNPLSHGGPPTVADTLEAELTAYAAGVRLMVLPVQWDAVAEQGVEPVAKKVAEYRARGLKVVLVLRVVFRHVARRPPDVALKEWDDVATIDAAKQAIDQLLAAVGPDLAAFVLGRDVDVYLMDHIDEVTPIAAFFTEAFAHLAAHPTPVPAAVGMSFSDQMQSSTYQQFAALGDLFAVSYLPGIGQAVLPKDASAAKDLDAMVQSSAGRPILLQAVGYTSAAALGAGAEQQAGRFADLFQALAKRRDRFPFVHVEQLYDLDEGACAAHASGQQLPGDHPEIVFGCNAGLRGAGGKPKAAWLSFVSASAGFATP